MNEIGKMYENAGINQVCNTCELKGFKRLCPSKELCVRTNPTFTAEKQLLLVQWLLDKTDLYLHRHKTDFTYSIATGNISVNKNKDFKESIAEFINTIWQYLSEEEKQQVKDILK